MSDLDDVFRALAAERRRIALSYLQNHRSLALADLAELVAEEEWGKNVTAIGDEFVRDVYLSLYHTHVPELEDAHLVQYTQDQDIVATTDRTGPLLDAVEGSVRSLRATE